MVLIRTIGKYPLAIDQVIPWPEVKVNSDKPEHGGKGTRDSKATSQFQSIYGWYLHKSFKSTPALTAGK